MFEIHEAFRRGLIWKNASQIQFHQFYNPLRDVCYKKKNCHVHELLSRQYSLPISENISTSSGILNSRTLSPKLGHVNENLNENCSWFVLVEVLKFDSDPGLFTVYMHKKITFSKDF